MTNPTPNVEQLAAEIAQRYEAVMSRLRAAGGDDVTVIAVAKTFPAESVLAATMAGIADIGESYAQEFVAKHAEATELLAGGAEPRWHFIGGLQRNKVRKVAHLVDLWHSVDRPSLATEIAKHSPGASVLLQVDISDEDQKKGCPPHELEALLATAVDAGLHVAGLMGMPVLGDPEAARPGFRLLRGLADSLELSEVSMGMSGDLEVAVDEGATIIRVGSALFGPRR